MGENYACEESENGSWYFWNAWWDKWGWRIGHSQGIWKVRWAETSSSICKEIL